MDAPRVRKRPVGLSPPPWGDTPSFSSLTSLRGSLWNETGSVRLEAGRQRPKKKKRKLTNTRLCPWENCEVRVDKNDDALFDHVVQDHIAPLKGEEEREKERRKEEEKRNGEKEDSEESEDDESEADPYACHWPDCGKSLTRGDETRKIAWLEEHLHSRHIPAAGRFRCGKCKFRGKTKRLVDDHEKKCGKEEKKKREPRASPLLFYHPADPRPPPPKRSNKPPVQPAKCFQYARVANPKLHPLLADFDPAVHEQLQRVLDFKMEHDWNVRRELKPGCKELVGANWRKARLSGESYQYVAVDVEKERVEKEEKERLWNEEMTSINVDDLPQSLDELFPPPEGYPLNERLEFLGAWQAEPAYIEACETEERRAAFDAAAGRPIAVPVRHAGAAADGRLAVVRPSDGSSATTTTKRRRLRADELFVGSAPYSPASLAEPPHQPCCSSSTPN